jgi:DNA-directed RNA polymerase specialized sigma subunit
VYRREQCLRTACRILYLRRQNSADGGRILDQENKANAVEESMEEKEKLLRAIEQLSQLERLGSNRDSTRIPPRK